MDESARGSRATLLAHDIEAVAGSDRRTPRSRRGVRQFLRCVLYYIPATSGDSSMSSGSRPASLATATTCDCGCLSLFATIGQEVLGVSGDPDVGQERTRATGTTCHARVGPTTPKQLGQSIGSFGRSDRSAPRCTRLRARQPPTTAAQITEIAEAVQNSFDTASSLVE
jgi:hypothetical protein